MTLKIYVTKNLYSYNTFFIDFLKNLNINIEFVDNYDRDDIDILILWYNNILKKHPSNFNKYKKNYTIINRVENTYYLTNKDFLNNFHFVPYSFTIKFNNLKYDKKLIKQYIDKYKYNKYFGKDYWILKNNSSSGGSGTIIVKTNDLYNLDNNKDFLDENKDYKNKKMTYIIQKYLEKPAIINNKKYDLRVHFVLFSKFNDDNNIIYKFYLYNKIYTRITKYDFDLTNTDKKIHLTNTSIQKNYNFYSLDHFVTNDIYNKIYDNIYIQLRELISSKTFIDIIKQNNKYPYFYNIFGIDVLLDEDYNTYIIDFNSNPGIYIARYQYFYQADDSDSFNEVHLLSCIYYKLFRIYNKYKKIINEDNIEYFNKYKDKYSFKNNFRSIYKFQNNKT